MDENNVNYSLPVTFGDVVYDASISGIDGIPVLAPARTSGDTYLVGSNYNLTVKSTYTIVDLAGNTGTCEWEIFIDNPNPCVWPTCGDQPPTVVSCPNNLNLGCAQNENCGCGQWDIPQFTDDKGVVRTEVYFNDVLDANNGPDSQLSIGITNVRYRAYDMHDTYADCNFTVQIIDPIRPVFDDCPVSESFDVADNNVYDYTYTVNAYDECVLNENVDYNVVNFPAADEHADGSDTLSVNTVNNYHYTATDDEGNVEDCKWTITIVDTGDPTAICPANIEKRIAQSSTSVNVPYTADATDDGSDTVNIDIDYSIEPNSAFEEGNTTVTVVVTDEAVIMIHVLLLLLFYQHIHLHILKLY